MTSPTYSVNSTHIYIYLQHINRASGIMVSSMHTHISHVVLNLAVNSKQIYIFPFDVVTPNAAFVLLRYRNTNENHRLYFVYPISQSPGN